MKKYFVQVVITSVCALAIFLIGFSAGLVRSSFIAQPNLSGAPIKAITFLINDGEYVKSYTGLSITQPSTALQLLEMIGEREKLILDIDKSSSMGAFVKQIGNKVSGQNQMYWQYYVNGSQPMVAADRYILQGGEIVLWTFSKSEY